MWAEWKVQDVLYLALLTPVPSFEILTSGLALSCIAQSFPGEGEINKCMNGREGEEAAELEGKPEKAEKEEFLTERRA